MYSIFLSNEDQAIEFGGRGAIGFVCTERVGSKGFCSEFGGSREMIAVLRHSSGQLDFQSNNYVCIKFWLTVIVVKTAEKKIGRACCRVPRGRGVRRSQYSNTIGDTCRREAKSVLSY